MGNKRKKHQHSHAPKRSPNQAVYFPPVDEEQLVGQALALHPLLTNRTAALRKLQTHELCYVISTRWLKDWKDYVGYGLVTGDEEEGAKKDKKFGKRHPGKINTDITASANQSRQFYSMPEALKGYEYLGEFIGEKKEKNEDYIAVTEQIWNAFIQHYEGQAIRRPVHTNKKRTFYDTDLLRMDVIFLDMLNFDELENKIKETSKKNYNTVLPSDKLQFPTIWTFDDLEKYLRLFTEAQYNSNKIRIWKGHSYIATNPLAIGLVESIKAKNFVMQGRELNGKRYEDKDIDDYLKSTHTLIVEIGQTFVPDKESEEVVFGYCQECIEKKKLPVVCICGQMFYCSRKCRNDDQSFHFRTCKGAFDSSDDEQWTKYETEQVPKGGLDNLGNTCYMNSSIQALLSIPHIRRFFTSNRYLKQMDKKQHDLHNCMLLRKFSKASKALSKQKQYTPWPLKAQIDYNLHPFIGYGQHDAYEFTINLINAIDDQLAKENQRAHHQIIDVMSGTFYSKVTCPHCQVESQTTDMFLQISLPIKEKTHQKMYSYIVVESPTKVRRGKALVVDKWDDMRTNIEAPDSTTCLLNDNVVVIIDQSQSPQKVTRQGKTIVYYKGLEVHEGQTPFTFGLVNAQVMCNTLMKSPYGTKMLIPIEIPRFTLGTFWLHIIRYFLQDNQLIVNEANAMEKDFERKIEQMVKQEVKQQEVKKEEGENKVEQSESVSTEAQTQISKVEKFIDKATDQLRQFATRIGIEVYVHQTRRKKSKKGGTYDLPKTFNEPLSVFLEGKLGHVDFQVYLSKSLDINYTDRNMGVAGEPDLHACLELFTQPEQLDEDNAFYCVHCDSMGLALKELHVNTFPPVLVLHLNRFKAVQQKKVKNNEPIKYNKNEQFGGHEYQLLAVVIHEGGMEGGHYWAIGLRGDRYYVFNDSKVSPVEDVFCKNAYLLIYQRVDFQL